MSDWHFRYRRIIDAYRAALSVTDPGTCRAIDGEMERAGEHWVCDDTPLPRLDELWSAARIAKRWGFNRWDIANWARAGEIQRYDTPTGTRYRVGEVLAYFSLKNSHSQGV